MSEYQYYEFACVDQLLTATQQAELRSFSTRATITASSFVNEYHWGNLKGDPLEWVQQYFDAHVYSSNWGSCRLLLRLPHGTFDAATIRDYVKAGRKRRSCFEKAFEAMDVDDWCLLDWSFNDDSGEHARFSEEMDGAGWMTRLPPVRDELLGGDARPLYLGWLARLGNDELHDDEIEPPVPAGLQALTPAQVALAEFLMLDADWLAAAAEASPSLLAPESSGSEDSRFDPWLRELPVEEMRTKLRMLLQGRSLEAERTLRNAFLKWEKGRNAKQLNLPRRRRISEIESRAASHRAIREKKEQEARQAAAVRRREERTRYLTSLLEQEDTAWSSIDAQLRRTTGSAYDQAFQKLQDLAEAYENARRDAVFRRRLAQLMSSHGKRGAWLARLEKAGYLWQPKS
ncbi:hypothetical protein M3A49_38930 [Paraburkholderia sp. CNPSo 3076]|uniref:hypothetical protein n=1 Tax=Paraburkholderia sp. CNPSo 3076 TaxID=2940936 RepID=UPI00224E0EC4|nr:hypothetical protein [Paraburkholderia sp. CNPSo 3076]MCX5545343.1 hypothetical protein [Paraburkholderia sp. CNPSo 3076]